MMRLSLKDMSLASMECSTRSYLDFEVEEEGEESDDLKHSVDDDLVLPKVCG